MCELENDDNTEKVTFDVKKSDGIRIKVMLNMMLSFETMSSRMNFKC